MTRDRAGAGLRRVLTRTAGALVPLVVLLVLSELALWAFGLGDPQERLSLMRGFSEKARYLVPDPERPGGWRTQMWKQDSREVRIGPKGPRLRVLLFGGSNTQGFPGEVIEQRLNELAPEPGYEVINLGRAGYGSERVRILLDQAMVLQPDIVFIYCGHNEFVERGFAIELASAWRRPWVERGAEALTHLRTLNVLISLCERVAAPPATSGQRPEGRRERTSDFDRLTYDQTRVFYDLYRDNLQAMLRTAREHGAQVMLCTVIGNMLVPPVVIGAPEGATPEQLQAFRELQHEALELWPPRLRTGVVPTDAEHPATEIVAQDWGEAVGAEELDRRRGLGAHPEPPALRGLTGPFAGGPYWGDPALWTPTVLQSLPVIAAVSLRQLAPGERSALERAAALLEQARALCPTDSLALFQSGVCAWLLGEDDAAACRLLRESARYDRAPRRGNDVTNGIVRELAAEHTEVYLVDAEGYAASCSPGGLIGYEIMEDTCHLHPDLRPLLMDAFVPGLQELGDASLRARAH